MFRLRALLAAAALLTSGASGGGPAPTTARTRAVVGAVAARPAIVAAGTTGAVRARGGAPADVRRSVGTGVDVPAVRRAAAPGGVVALRLELPLAGPVTVVGPFRAPPDRYGAGHRGVDLAAPPGTVVRAAAEGQVAYAGPVADRGVLSILHAGGARTTYEPVTGMVAAGDRVTVGQPVARVDGGHAGCVAGCLHWGLRTADGGYLDPLLFVGRWSVRLLPWRDGG